MTAEKEFPEALASRTMWFQHPLAKQKLQALKPKLEL
jgi:hypothetical protein